MAHVEIGQGLEPPPSRWQLPPPGRADDHGLVAVGADLAPGTLLAAYRSGLFPMPVRKRTIGWWSPDPRAVIPLDGLRVTRATRASVRRMGDVRFGTAFADVVRRCGDPARPHGWITPAIVDAYAALHELGWATSVEVWRGDRLVGGLYGVRVGGLFAGESMFHDERDASKVALVALVDWLRDTGATLLDVQWLTPHLTSLGAVAIPRTEYLRRLATAIAIAVD